MTEIKEPKIVDRGPMLDERKRWWTYCPDCGRGVGQRASVRHKQGKVIYVCKCGCEYYGRNVRNGK